MGPRDSKRSGLLGSVGPARERGKQVNRAEQPGDRPDPRLEFDLPIVPVGGSQRDLETPSRSERQRKPEDREQFSGAPGRPAEGEQDEEEPLEASDRERPAAEPRSLGVLEGEAFADRDDPAGSEELQEASDDEERAIHTPPTPARMKNYGGGSSVRARKNGSSTTLQVAGLDRLPVVVLGTASGVGEQFVDFLVEGVVEVRGDVLVIERFLHGGFDDEVCHTIPPSRFQLINVLFTCRIAGVSRAPTAIYRLLPPKSIYDDDRAAGRDRSIGVPLSRACRRIRVRADPRRGMRDILEAVAAGELSPARAEAELAGYVTSEAGRFDAARGERRGIPEAILAEGKTPEQIASLAAVAVETTDRALITRIGDEGVAAVKDGLADADATIERRGSTLVVRAADHEPPELAATVGLVTAGTVDGPVADEAEVVCADAGATVDRIDDVGVAALDRTLDQVDRLSRADVLIVCAGREGALPTVIAGLVDTPVIGVPVSSGYGFGGDGRAALSGMLQSCTVLSVVNVDAGFVAGCQAALIARAIDAARG